MRLPNEHRIQPADYFLTVHSFAVEGLDTTEAAFKILGEESFQLFIPQHSLTLNQETCLLYLLLPTSEDFYRDQVERRLFAERSVAAQKSLLSVLAQTVTRQGDAAIERAATSPDVADDLRAYARMIQKNMKAMASASMMGLSTSSYDELKDEQRKLFQRVSDEALSDWERLRIKLRRKGPK